MQSQESCSKNSWREVVTASQGSLWIAGLVLLFDLGLEGARLLSTAICPLWFLISLLKNIIKPPERSVAIFRISLPVLTFAIAMANGELQWKISDANAERVVKACDEFRVVNGRYPKTLDELVPDYFPSVPPAKHCMLGGNFWYFNMDGHCSLMWSRYGFYRRTYEFDSKRWGNVD